MSEPIDSFITRSPSGHPVEPDGLAITPERMSNQLAAELLEAIDSGDFNLTDWDVDFIGNNLGREHFSLKQKRVIYNLARKFKLL